MSQHFNLCHSLCIFHLQLYPFISNDLRVMVECDRQQVIKMVCLFWSFLVIYYPLIESYYHPRLLCQIIQQILWLMFQVMLCFLVHLSFFWNLYGLLCNFYKF